MTAAVRSRLVAGLIRPDELHAEWMPYRHRRDGRTSGVVVGLSHNAQVQGYFMPPYDDEVRAIASAGMAAVVPGSSGSSWGNDDAVAAIGESVRYLRQELGCRGRVGLLGFSMGALAVCSWARTHPDEVAALALVTPALDLAHLRAQSPFADEIERAHGGPAAFEAALPERDPSTYAAALHQIPTHIWYATDDPVIAWQTVVAFAERHGGPVMLSSLGAVGHNPAGAPGPAIARFFAEH